MSTSPGFNDTLTRNMELQSVSTSKEFETASNGDSDFKFNIGCSKYIPTTQHQNDKITFKSISDCKTSSAADFTQNNSSKNANYKFTYRYY